MGISRRDFLKISAIGGTLLSGLGSYYFQRVAGIQQSGVELKTVRSVCSPNCTGACGFEALVYNGRIETLTQAADYPESEYDPRGCLRGQSMVNLIYGPDRLKKPLIRVGKRGEGKFRAVSWDEALDHVADKLVEIMRKYGPESVAISIQVPGTGYVHKGAMVRLASMFGWSSLHGYTMNGDLPAFWSQTFGVQTEEFESLEWANSRYVVIFGSNVMVTRLPDAKFLTLAAERGAKIAVVDPNFTPTAAKADEWVQINPSTDSALALGIVREIINKGLYDEEFIKTYTDMPLLVRLDNKKRLRAQDVKRLKEVVEKMDVPEYREVFVIYDVNNGFKPVNPETLERDFDPILEGEFEVKLVDGKTVKVKPVFQLLKEEVEKYTPEKVAEIITPPNRDKSEYTETIRRLAVEMATVKPLHIIYGASNYQWFHGDLKGRALSLIVALTGNIGKSGAGISTYAGQFKIRWPLGAWWSFKGRKNKWVTYLLWMNKEYRESEEFKKYNRETPYPKNDVKAFLFGWNNPFDQHNMANRMIEYAESGELELIVAIDFQMTTSCKWADVVLPGVTWYEKYELTATILHPYVQIQQPAIEPLFECMPEIWIFKELAKRLVERWDDEELKRRIAEFYPDSQLFMEEEEAIRGGRWNLKLAREIANKASLKAIELMLETGGELVEGITLEKLLKGPVRLNLPTPNKRQIPFWEQINLKKPFPPQSFPVPLSKTARFVKSGRIEFYKEEDVFIDLGETLPVHKDPFVDTEYKVNPEAKMKYKYVYITRNALYRVHSTHSNNITMLELQDFKPRVWMNPQTAKENGIKEGDLVEVYNDRGKVYGYAVFDTGLHPGVIIFEQGWWSRYLRGTSYNSLTYPWIKATHLAYFVPGIWEPTTAWNEAACAVRKVQM
ncbi:MULTISPECIES: molybdopterin-dependent oxidoreductase [unclassified Archaeoglobus]|jgi:anaerobic selenocysteine-containing dehydrogenase|uniref:molybdopterin-dependent oxidoreductase n=1 Tax=unclassified Archaeoglobus TaxID=2643606 RepID=UPI0025B96ADB|nr:MULTISPECIES: molybdopterin-dependent oxidoreductase [unclassified Archaeoglobus]